MPTEGLSEEKNAALLRAEREVYIEQDGWFVVSFEAMHRLLDAARAEGPAPPGGAETALRKLLAPADLHHVADHERLRLSSRRFDLGLSIGELRAALAKGADRG